jgi:nitrogen fixation-related uncharacterized protein
VTLNDRLYRLLRLPMPVLSLRTIVIVAALSVIAVVITIGTWVWIGVTNDQYSQLDRRLDSLSSLGDVSALLGSAPHTDTGQPAPDRNLVRTVRVGDITASMPSDIVLPALPAGYADTTINGVPYRVRTVTAGPAGEADCSAGDVYRDNRSGSASMGTLRSLPPLPLTCTTAAPSSVVRMSPMSAWGSSSARRPASSAVRMSARSLSAQFVWRFEF